MLNYESFGLLCTLAPAYAGVTAAIMVIAEEVWGTDGMIKRIKIGFHKEKRRRIEWAASLLLAPILFIGFWYAIPVMMDIPGILAGEYRSMEGTVKDYRYGSKEGGSGIVGEIIVEDDSGELFRSINIHVPKFLEIGDRVKVDYRKYGKSGVIRKINGESFEKFGRKNAGLFQIILIYLLFSMPVYVAYIFKCRPFLYRKKNYSVSVYHDDLVRSIKVVEILRLQSIAVMFIAIMEFSGIIMDIYWGLLVIGNYIGIACLSFFRHKRFTLMKDRFYYRDLKQEIEGSIEEIESVERKKEGVVIRTKEEEMEIRCTKEKYVEELMKKIGKEEEKNDGE